MIGVLGNFSGYLALRAGLTGLPHAFGSYAGAGYGSNSGRLFDTSGSTLRAFETGRNEIDRITAGLTKLRDALQATRDQPGFVSGRTDLRAVVTDLDLLVDQPTYVTQEVTATQVSGTRDLSGYDDTSAAGLKNNDHFTVQVGSGLVADITFKNSTQIEVTIDSSTQSFTFSGTGGDWRTGLVDALNSVAGLSAEIAADGTLSLETTNGESLTIAAPAPGKNPLASIGLTAGTTDPSVVGTEQVQTGTIQVSRGSRPITVGYDHVVRQGVGVEDTVRQLASDVATLTASVGADAVRAFAADVWALLRSDDFAAAINGTDAAALDTVIGRLNDTLARADSLRVPIGVGRSTAGQVNLGGILLSASLQFPVGDSSSQTRQTADSLYRSSFDSVAGSRISSLV